MTNKVNCNVKGIAMFGEGCTDRSSLILEGWLSMGAKV